MKKIIGLLTFIVICACIGTVSCDERFTNEHSHTFLSLVNIDCVKETATCTHATIYYQSCACGEKSENTFEYGEKLSHTFNEIVNNRYIISNPTCTSAAIYYTSCECGERGSTTFTNGSSLEHIYNQSLSNQTICSRCNDSCLSYKIENNTISIIGIGECKESVVYIPDKINGMDVTSISSLYSKDITRVIVPDSIVLIKSGAFASCSSLVDIQLPDTAIRIETGAFNNCGYYNDVNNWIENRTVLDKLNYKILYIGHHLIAAQTGNGNYMSKLSYTIRSGTLTIADSAFYDCYFPNISIPTSVVSIGKKAFYYCSLKSISLSKNITFIGENAFYNNDISTNYFAVYYAGTIQQWEDIVKNKDIIGGCEYIDIFCCDGTL